MPFVQSLLVTWTIPIVSVSLLRSHLIRFAYASWFGRVVLKPPNSVKMTIGLPSINAVVGVLVPPARYPVVPILGTFIMVRRGAPVNGSYCFQTPVLGVVSHNHTSMDPSFT